MPHLSDELLSAFLDRETSSEEDRAVRAHLSDCARCSGALSAFARLDHEARAVPSLACSAAAPLLSAELDGELAAAEREVAAAHLTRCGDCRAERASWAALDQVLASLPQVAPAARVDAAMRALVARDSRGGGPGGLGWALRGVAAATAAVALALALLSPRGGPPEVALPEPAPFAAVQQSVLDPRTGTLYVLRPDQGLVAALDSLTHAERARIAVGGRPTALALNEAARAILVLDATAKTVTEISTENNAVIAQAALDVPGTLTSIQVGPAGKIVVAAAATAVRGAQASGVVAVLDGATKRLETVRTVDVAPRLVVLDGSGRRALLVSPEATTLADTTTYQPLERLDGGVAAAFASQGEGIAILSARDGGAWLRLHGAIAPLALPGAPRALVALPGGGFAALTDTGARGLITVVSQAGIAQPPLAVAAAAGDLAYDEASGRFSVIGSGSVASAALPAAAAAPSPPPAVVPSPSPSPAPSAPPAASPSVVTALARPPSAPAYPPGARQAWPNTARLETGARPVALGGEGARLWYVDRAGWLASLHTASAQVFHIAQLPAGATASRIVATANYVYVADVPAGRLHLLTLAGERLSTVAVPFLSRATSFAATGDDKLWFSTADLGQLVSYDPRSGRVQTVPVAGGTIGAIATDGTGRVWFAARREGWLGVYESLAAKLTVLAFAPSGAVTSLLVDRSGTLWAGTEAGELFALQGGALHGGASIGRPISALVLDPGGAAWYVAPTAHELVYGPLDGSEAARRVLAGLAGPAFDVAGRAWLADPGSGGFYITVVAGR